MCICKCQYTPIYTYIFTCTYMCKWWNEPTELLNRKLKNKNNSKINYSDSTIHYVSKYLWLRAYGKNDKAKLPTTTITVTTTTTKYWIKQELIACESNNNVYGCCFYFCQRWINESAIVIESVVECVKPLKFARVRTHIHYKHTSLHIQSHA